MIIFNFHPVAVCNSIMPQGKNGVKKWLSTNKQTHISTSIYTNVCARSHEYVCIIDTNIPDVI